MEGQLDPGLRVYPGALLPWQDWGQSSHGVESTKALPAALAEGVMTLDTERLPIP